MLNAKTSSVRQSRHALGGSAFFPNMNHTFHWSYKLSFCYTHETYFWRKKTTIDIFYFDQYRQSVRKGACYIDNLLDKHNLFNMYNSQTQLNTTSSRRWRLPKTLRNRSCISILNDTLFDHEHLKPALIHIRQDGFFFYVHLHHL